MCIQNRHKPIRFQLANRILVPLAIYIVCLLAIVLYLEFVMNESLINQAELVIN